MRKLLTEIAKARLQPNSLKHSLLSLERYFKAVKDEGCVSWAILVPRPDDDTLEKALRSVPLAFFHIGVDWTGGGKEESTWGAFVLNISHTRFAGLKAKHNLRGLVCTYEDDLDPKFWIEELRQAMDVDVVNLRMFPLSIAEGMLFQTIIQELREDPDSAD